MVADRGIGGIKRANGKAVAFISSQESGYTLGNRARDSEIRRASE